MDATQTIMQIVPDSNSYDANKSSQTQQSGKDEFKSMLEQKSNEGIGTQDKFKDDTGNDYDYEEAMQNITSADLAVKSGSFIKDLSSFSNSAVQMITANMQGEQQATNLATLLAGAANGETTIQKPMAEAMSQANANVALQEGDAQVQVVQSHSADTQSGTTAGDGTEQNLADDIKTVELATGQKTALFEGVENTPVKVGEAEVVDTTKAVEKALEAKISQALSNGTEQLTLKLTPEHLGNVTVDITRLADGAISVLLRADTDAATKLLSEHSNALSLLLQNSSNEVRVVVQQPGESEQMWQHTNQDGRNNARDGEQQQKSDDEQSPEDFMQKLRLGLLPLQTQSA